jgi:tetratricopeptide (TPR) repeat protein
MLGDILKEQDQLDEAAEMYEASLKRSSGDAVVSASARLELGNIALSKGDLEVAEPLLIASREGYEQLGTRWGIVVALDACGRLELARGDQERALAAFQRSLSTGIEARVLSFAIGAVVGLSAVAARMGQVERAVELLSAARHHPAAEHYLRTKVIEPRFIALSSELPQEEFESAAERGKTMDLESVARDPVPRLH